MLDIDFKRQTALFNPARFEEIHVTIIGLGNIGSHAALTLARMGIQHFHLFDPDTIENHNLSSQSYGKRFIGAPKVEAIKHQLLEIDPLIEVDTHQHNYAAPIPVTNITVIGVDSLQARREIAEIIPVNHLLIDGRIGGEQLELYVSNTVDEWKKTIPAGEADPDPCGAQYICYVSVIIGGIIANLVKKHLKGETLSKSILINVNSLDILKDFNWD